MSNSSLNHIYSFLDYRDLVSNKVIRIIDNRVLGEDEAFMTYLDLMLQFDLSMKGIETGGGVYVNF